MLCNGLQTIANGTPQGWTCYKWAVGENHTFVFVFFCLIVVINCAAVNSTTLQHISNCLMRTSLSQPPNNENWKILKLLITVFLILVKFEIYSFFIHLGFCIFTGCFGVPHCVTRSCPPLHFNLAAFSDCPDKEPLGLDELPPAFTPCSTPPCWGIDVHQKSCHQDRPAAFMCATMARRSCLCHWGHRRNQLQSTFKGGTLFFSVAAATPHQCPHKLDDFSAAQRSLMMGLTLRSPAEVRWTWDQCSL